MKKLIIIVAITVITLLGCCSGTPSQQELQGVIGKKPVIEFLDNRGGSIKGYGYLIQIDKSYVLVILNSHGGVEIKDIFSYNKIQ